MDGPRRFRNQPHNRGRGKVGEDAAVRWLVEQGYRVVERNVQDRRGEIDLVAREAGVLCFVEIKARAGDRHGPAVAAVTANKQARLARAAARYLGRKPWDGPCRFDVLGMDLTPDGWRFTLIRDAFSVPSGAF